MTSFRFKWAYGNTMQDLNGGGVLTYIFNLLGRSGLKARDFRSIRYTASYMDVFSVDNCGPEVELPLGLSR